VSETILVINEKYKRRITPLQRRIKELMCDGPAEAEDRDEEIDGEDPKRKRAKQQDDMIIEINSDLDNDKENVIGAHLKDDAAEYNESPSKSIDHGGSSSDKDINANLCRERLVIEIDLESDDDSSLGEGKDDNYTSNEDVNGEDEIVAEEDGHSVSTDKIE